MLGMRFRVLLIWSICALFVVASPLPAQAASQCGAPVSYSLGAIDPRFNISKAEVIQALADAETVWESPTGRSLLSYTPQYGRVTVNFFYDERQATTDLQKEKLGKLEKIDTIYKGLQRAIDTYASSTATEQAALATNFAAYKADEARYNAEVSAANSQGGASQSEYERLTNTKADLKVRFDSLKNTETEMNARIARFNTLVSLVNQLATYLNTYIGQYNATLGAAREYQEGIYERTGSLQQINMYQYSDRDQLVRALSHEMGHALGIGHIEDPTAIMYRTNSAKTLTATPADISALKSVCGI